MKYYKINPQDPDPNVLKETVTVLEKGGIVVYPTDTLYGLGVDAYNKKAIKRLYTIKNRSLNKPTSLMMPDLQLVKEIFGFKPASLERELKKLFPGRLTALIANHLHKRIPAIERLDTPGSVQEKVGIRIPDHPFCRELSKMYDSPVTSTSANLSGAENPLVISEIIGQLGSKVDLIIDAGQLSPSRGSTIIDFTRTPYLILRAGDLSAKEIERKINKRVVSKYDKFIITFVCSGNICRSPMAMGIMRRMLERTKYRPVIKIQSAGTLRLPRQMADHTAIDVCLENGVQIGDHFSQHINDHIVEESSLIFCLAQNHINYLHKHFPEHKKKIVLLKQWKRKENLFIPSIADPIGHDKDFFKETYREIHEEIKRVLPFLLAEIKKFTRVRDLQF